MSEELKTIKKPNKYIKGLKDFGKGLIVLAVFVGSIYVLGMAVGFICRLFIAGWNLIF